MKRTVEAEEGRLDVVVVRMTGMPRGDVQRAIAAGTVRVDGEPREKSFRLRGGERLTIEIEPDAPLSAEGPSVPIRYEDDELAVVAKPAGLVTHPTAGRRGGTLVNRLLGMGVPLAPAGGTLRPGIVHRLDAGTSGLIVVAKTDEAYAALRRLFHDHAVDRAYLALVRGSVGNDAFAVDAPLGRRASKIVVDATEGRRAETRFEVRERFDGATLLEAVPRTGRTHQIRVHLAAIGHPILGDRAYGGGGNDARGLGLDRPFLHAGHLSFAHPITGRMVTLDEGLPEDLRSALHRLHERLA
ncbi:MAG TPA: RluA family pseudouridine synthase [Actinomycetota bacterium]